MSNPVRSYRLTDHALSEMRRRKIPLMVLDMVLSQHEAIIAEGHSGREVYVARVDITEGKQAVLRVVVEPGEPLVVVTDLSLWSAASYANLLAVVRQFCFSRSWTDVR